MAISPDEFPSMLGGKEERKQRSKESKKQSIKEANKQLVRSKQVDRFIVAYKNPRPNYNFSKTQ